MNNKRESIQALFDNSPIPTWVFDMQTLQFLYVNKAAIRHYGYSEEEFYQMTIQDIRPYEDSEMLLDYLAGTEDGTAEEKEIWRHIKKSGEEFYVRIYFNPMTFEGKKARLIQAIDINETVFALKKNKELTETLKRRNRYVDDILSSVKEIIWSRTIDDHRLLYINRASIEVYGYTPEEMIGTIGKSLDNVHPEDRDKMREKIDNVIRTGSGPIDYRIIRKDGTIRYLSGQAVYKRGEWGEPDVINGVSIDVTQLVETQRKLKEKETEVTYILESITDAFFEVDRNWKITYVNQEFENLFQMSRDQLVGRDLWECFPKLAESDFNDIYHQAMEKGKSMLQEGYSPASGRWLAANCYPTKKGFAVYLRDVTEEREMRDRIANDQQQLRAIINNTKDVIWSIDRDLNILTANQSFWERLSLITGKIMPEEYKQWVKENNNIELFERWAHYFKRALNGETYAIEEGSEYIGKTVYEEISFNPIYDKDGNVMGVCCFSRDITDRKNYMLKIQAQNEKFKEIAWMLSHTVRSHVASILGLAQIFDHDNIADPENAIIVDGLLSASQMLDKEIKHINAKTKIAGLE